nr:hypothetical protein [Tanacetum cinerariifolium]
MSTLAEYLMVVSVENRPPMLDKSMYNSWEIRMLLYIKGKNNGRMMLKSIENGPLVYLTVEENGLPPDVYALVNHCKSAKDIWERVKLLMKGMEMSYQERECKLYNEFDKVTVQQVQGRQGQSFAGIRTKGNATSLRGNNATVQARVVKCYNCQDEWHMARQCTQTKRPRNAAWFKEKLILAEEQGSGQVLDEEKLAFLVDLGIIDCYDVQPTIIHIAAFQTNDLDAYDSDCDDIYSTKAVLMANLSSYGSDVLSKTKINTTTTSYSTYFLATAACTIYRTRCGFVLGSDGGGDGESCKWQEMEKVGFTEVFSIWKAFGGNTRDLGSFGEETDKTTNLYQHLLRISTQRLETASQITGDAVTTHTKTASQDLKTVSDCKIQPII